MEHIKQEPKEDELQQLSESLGFKVVSQHSLALDVNKEIEEEIKAKNLKQLKKNMNKKKKSEENAEEIVIVKEEPQEGILTNIKKEVEEVKLSELPQVESIVEDEIPEDQVNTSSLKKEEDIDVIRKELGYKFYDSECSSEVYESEGSEYIPEDEVGTKKRRSKKQDYFSEESFEDIEEDLELDSDDDFSDLENENETDNDNKIRNHLSVKDDFEERDYKARVQQWIELRQKHRGESIEVEEEYAPHPNYEDRTLNGGLKIPGEIVKDLLNYQKKGVRWLWELFKLNQGGVLADEMGLGKTIQSITFLASLYYSKKLNRPSLIICPATITSQWVQEIHRWWPPLRVINLNALKVPIKKLKSFKLGNRRRFKSTIRSDNLLHTIKDHFKPGTIFITSYEGALSYGPKFSNLAWGCLFLDEGHKISNPDTQTSKACKVFNTEHRYILSGTPIQNKLRELWSIFDFVLPGLLGTLEEFDNRIARSIELTSVKGDDIFGRQVAIETAKGLREMIKKHLLRRLKLEVNKELPKKEEIVLLCKLHYKQYKAYVRYLNSEECNSILSDKKNHMVGMSTLRKISNHPDLQYYKDQRNVNHYGHYKKSGKTLVLDGFLRLWKQHNHRVLIFCQTIQMQDILRKMEFFKNTNYLYMNGTTTVSKRLSLVDEFNSNTSIFAFILTTRTGGQGLNLTGADRVVIFDPDWNPSADLQALSRAWRLGQMREVKIYRFIAEGTIEQRVHHLQLYKQILADRILNDPQQKLFFKNHTKELFAYPPRESVLPKKGDSNGGSVTSGGNNNDESLDNGNMSQDNSDESQDNEPNQNMGEMFSIVKEENKETEVKTEPKNDSMKAQLYDLIGISQTATYNQQYKKNTKVESNDVRNIVLNAVSRNFKHLQRTSNLAINLQKMQLPSGVSDGSNMPKEAVFSENKAVKIDKLFNSILTKGDGDSKSNNNKYENQKPNNQINNTIEKRIVAPSNSLKINPAQTIKSSSKDVRLLSKLGVVLPNNKLSRKHERFFNGQSGMGLSKKAVPNTFKVGEIRSQRGGFNPFNLGEIRARRPVSNTLKMGEILPRNSASNTAKLGEIRPQRATLNTIQISEFQPQKLSSNTPKLGEILPRKPNNISSQYRPEAMNSISKPNTISNFLIANNKGSSNGSKLKDSIRVNKNGTKDKK
ncbi:hypothetical protein K502DRAFT_309282 [Neoconidiobolus thromboides FSU 785]|nr:hypothetical protein K502DRAFT_309282 [Neoconidiobolus thromboides FSU 785]